MKHLNKLMFSLTCVLLLSACGSDLTSTRKVTSFTFIDQNRNPFGTSDLKQTVWIADFIFTNCETVCPPMSHEMAVLQKEFNNKGIDVQFVSFSVDPDVDSPEKLKEYISQFTDDDSNWHLLTGYSQETISTFAREQFQTIVQKPETSNQVIHGTNFYLVDKTGGIVKEYNYADDEYMNEILKDIKKINK